MLGLAVLLIVLALKPPRWVAGGAVAFAAICTLIGVGMLVDANRLADRWAAIRKCENAIPGNDMSAKMKKCDDQVSVVVANERYEN